jgi:hypothetical protein
MRQKANAFFECRKVNTVWPNPDVDTSYICEAVFSDFLYLRKRLKFSAFVVLKIFICVFIFGIIVVQLDGKRRFVSGSTRRESRDHFFKEQIYGMAAMRRGKRFRAAYCSCC